MLSACAIALIAIMKNIVNLNTKAQDWEKFIRQFEHQIYVQSKEYGVFNKETGEEFRIVTVQKNAKIMLGSIVLIIRARRANFIYLPYGPIISPEAKFSDFQAFIQALASLKKEYKLAFIRISPFYKRGTRLEKWLQKANFSPAPMHMIAEDAWILKLDQPIENLFKQMRQNHRNLINRAKRMEVNIESSSNLQDVKILSDLLQLTAKRHNFTAFSYEYLKQEFKAFQKQKAVRIYKAIYQGEVIAASMHFFWGSHVVYKHGASNSQFSKVPASYLLQYTAIQDAIQGGFKYYNFWGIAKPGAKKHPFLGITGFKKGFGGEYLDLIPAHDKILSMQYWINFIVEYFRKIKRGF